MSTKHKTSQGRMNSQMCTYVRRVTNCHGCRAKRLRVLASWCPKRRNTKILPRYCNGEGEFEQHAEHC